MTLDEIKELKERLLKSLAEPEEVQTDSGRVKRQSISQQIKALEELEKHERLSLADNGRQAKRIGIYKLNNKD